MEVGWGIETGVIVLRVGRTVGADARTRVVRHVVDHGVHDDAHARRLAAIHHVGEFGPRARAAAGDAVAHRLVALAPVVTRHDAVLFRGRDLYGGEAGRAEDVLALGRDLGPFPLEQVDEHVAGSHVAARSVGR